VRGAGTAPNVDGIAVTLRSCSDCAAFTAVLRRQLGRAGFRVRMAQRDGADIVLRRARFNALDPLAFVSAFSGEARSRPLQHGALARARRSAARLERHGAAFPIGTPALSALTSARLGCVRPTGLDLTTLCALDEG